MLVNIHCLERDIQSNILEKLLILDPEPTYLVLLLELETTWPMLLICSSKTEVSYIFTLPLSLHQIVREQVKCSKSLLYYLSQIIQFLKSTLLMVQLRKRKKRKRKPKRIKRRQRNKKENRKKLKMLRPRKNYLRPMNKLCLKLLFHLRKEN